METDPKRQYFNELAARWDSFPTIPEASAKICAYLERSIHPRPERILDIGCGTGILLPSMMKMYPNAKVIVEFDFAEQMLMENAKKFSDSRIIHVHGDANRLPFVVPTFDLILCFSTFPHLRDQRVILEQLLRSLRPGGVLTIGHMSASQELNDFHRSLDAPVNHDHLMPAVDLAKILKELEYCQIIAEEEKDWYFVRAEKPQV